MTTPASSSPTPSLRPVLTAGIAGGLAEVLWVSLYASMSPVDGMQVAREVTATIFGSAAGAGAYAPVLGVLIHMGLAIAVAAGFAALLWRHVERRYGAAGVMVASLATLLAIWTVNFYVVLPAINPVFVVLMPLSVTLLSKALFGIAMGLALNGAEVVGGSSRN